MSVVPAAVYFLPACLCHLETDHHLFLTSSVYSPQFFVLHEFIPNDIFFSLVNLLFLWYFFRSECRSEARVEPEVMIDLRWGSSIWDVIESSTSIMYNMLIKLNTFWCPS
ncbi:hypothetical protein DFH28DRAFT_941605 [Melampsora americana]|nr:hypothetical protein DFH28DRAFT_941605 [Melampsora americana]